MQREILQLPLPVLQLLMNLVIVLAFRPFRVLLPVKGLFTVSASLSMVFFFLIYRHFLHFLDSIVSLCF